jgi:hypothetical protein
MGFPISPLDASAYSIATFRESRTHDKRAGGRD